MLGPAVLDPRGKDTWLLINPDIDPLIMKEARGTQGSFLIHLNMLTFDSKG